MNETHVLARRPTNLLKNDHLALKALFEQYDGLGDGALEARKALFARIRRGLSIHSFIEEEIFYPAAEASEDKDARRLIQEARKDHRIVNELLEELSGMDAAEEGFDSKVNVLGRIVDQHSREEEEKIFPIVRALPEGELFDLAYWLEARKKSLEEEEQA